MITKLLLEKIVLSYHNRFFDRQDRCTAMTDMARLRPQGALRCQRKLTGGRAIGKRKGIIRENSEVFVGTAAV